MQSNANAAISNTFNEVGNVALVSLSHPKNAASPIFVNVDGNSISERL